MHGTITMSNKRVTIEDAEKFASESETYKKVLIHRKTCPKWGKSFCLLCFGGGLTQFTNDLEEEKKVMKK